MRVFVTGATGFIGSAIVADLISAGHEVLGLARSDERAAALAQIGVPAHRGDLTDLDSLIAGARACDGVIHTAYIHDFSQYTANAEVDRLAVAAMSEALAGSDKPLVITSGTLMLAGGASLGVETDQAPNPDGPRAISEKVVVAASARGVRGSVIRLPPSVHGAGDQGFVPMLIDIARRTGVAAYVGDGANRWPSVHRLDAARLYRLAVESAAPGARLHGVAEEGVPVRAIAETIGAGLGLPVKSLTAAEAPAHFGFLGMFIGADNTTSSAITRDSLGWAPQQPGLLEDVRANYFG
jgi:nucleoside-diphosphate-sugar epimerase